MKQDNRKLKPLIHMGGDEMRDKLAMRLARNGWWFNATTIDALCRIVRSSKPNGGVTVFPQGGA